MYVFVPLKFVIIGGGVPDVDVDAIALPLTLATVTYKSCVGDAPPIFEPNILITSFTMYPVDVSVVLIAVPAIVAVVTVSYTHLRAHET